MRFFRSSLALLFSASILSASSWSWAAPPSNEVNSWNWNPPATAPDTFQGAASLLVLQPARLLLETRGFGTNRRLLGPDGGEVYVWNDNDYRWSLKSGWTLYHWSSGIWRLERGDTRITGYPPVSLQGKTRGFLHFQFSDGSELWALQNAVSNQPYFEYAHASRKKFALLANESAYQLRKVGLEHTPFELFVSPAWEADLKEFAATGYASRLIELAKNELGLENTKIMGYLFDTHAEFERFHETPWDYAGWGNQFGFSVAAENDWVSMRNRGSIRFVSLLHEATHNLAHSSCARLQPRDGKVHFSPSWFDEGLANDTLIAIGDIYRGLFYQEIYRTLGEKGKERKVPFEDLNQSHRDALYPMGTMMVDYLRLEKGLAAIRAMYEGNCRGESFEASMRRVFGISSKEVYEQAFAYFVAHRSELEENARIWALSEAPRLQLVDEANALNLSWIPPVGLPSNWSEATQIKWPEPRQFDLEVGDIEAEKYCLGPDNGTVYVWDGGEYRWVLRSGGTIYRWPSRNWSLEIQGYKLNWFAGESPSYVLTYPDQNRLEVQYSRTGEPVIFRITDANTGAERIYRKPK